jgi:hypothetical protein
MKTLSILILCVVFFLNSGAQETGPIPAVKQKLTDYFSQYPVEKVYVKTDKTTYKPNEIIWFSAYITQANELVQNEAEKELFVNLYNETGKLITSAIFRINNGLVNGDLPIPGDLQKDQYFLVAYTASQISPEEIWYSMIQIDPKYSDQLVAQVEFQDSISVAGKENKLAIVVLDEAGNIPKNSKFKYQIVSGEQIIAQDKLKSDESGKMNIVFTIPAKSNGEPFICKLSDSKEEWIHEIFLPTNLDPVIVKFYPEGGNLTTGIASKIGFTAFNKWGIPVDIEGSIIDQDGNAATMVKTFSKGLGLFPLTPDGKKNYKLKISSTTGQNQTFEIPAANNSGLALSVAKTDTDFVSVNLYFSDKQKHQIALTINNYGNIYWAADLEINGMGRVKIPTENIPQGINLLSVFSSEGKLMAERIIFSDQKQQLKIDVQTEKLSLKQNQTMPVKIRLTDENNLPISGNITISIADKVWNTRQAENMSSYKVSSELLNPISSFGNVFRDQISNGPVMNAFLISNELKSFNWAKILNFKGESHKKQIGAETISEYIRAVAQKYHLANQNVISDMNYLKNNPSLFIEQPDIQRSTTSKSDAQQRLLENATSLMDVIKTIKPFKLESNQILFYGSENSLMSQSGALIILDGQKMGTDVSIIQGISPREIDHINISTNPVDIQRYTGLNSVGIIEIFQKKSVSKSLSVEMKPEENQYDGIYRIANDFHSTASQANNTGTSVEWLPLQRTNDQGIYEFSVTAGKVISDFEIDVQGVSGNGRSGHGKAVFSVTR